MSNPTELFPKTSIAAVSWVYSDNSTAIRVYTQHLNGDIRESIFDGKSWSFNEKFIIAHAKPNSPIAAFKHYEDIHVYYLTDQNFIQEAHWTGSAWAAGPLNDVKIQASPVSCLAAIPYVGGTDVDCHVFFQQPDGAIGLTKRVKNTWIPGSVVAPTALTGSGLAAIAFKGTDGDTYTGIRVFYQLPGGTLAEAWVDRNKDQWQQGVIKLLSGDPLTDASTDSNLSAYSVGDNPENPTHRLFFINSSNSVSEIGYYGHRWTVEHAGQTLARPGSGIAALRPDPNSKLRYFIQDETDQIVEWCTNDGSQQNFHKETVVPTGPVQ